VSQSVLIDLGEDWAVAVPADRSRRARPSRWPLALVAVLALVLSGSAAPERGLVAVFRVPLGVAGTFAMSEDGIYVSTGTQVTGYRLADGGVRWRALAPFRPQRLLVAGTVVLAQTGGAATDDQPGTVALDARTGRVLWIDPTLLDHVLPGSGLALVYTVSARGPAGLHAVQLRTGRTVWRGPETIGTRTVFDLGSVADRVARVAFWVPDGTPGTGTGTVQVVTEATGQVVASGRLPLQAGAEQAGAPGASWLGVAFGRLLVARRTGEGTQFTAFNLDTLAPDWHTTVASTVYTAADCGPVLCLYGADELNALDPTSGAMRWSSRVWVRAYPLPGGRLLLSGAAPGTGRRVVDAATLRPLSDLTSWTPVTGQAAAPLLSRDTAPLLTWFAVLDSEPGQPQVPRPVGSAAGVNRELCVTTAGQLACPTVHNELQVWRYRGRSLRLGAAAFRHSPRSPDVLLGLAVP
jgi:outer membrane protein assembly factor BamB